MTTERSIPLIKWYVFITDLSYNMEILNNTIPKSIKKIIELVSTKTN